MFSTNSISYITSEGYADDLVLVAPTSQALQLLLIFFTSKLSTLTLQVNVHKSCYIVFRHSYKMVLRSLTMNHQPLRQVMITTYLGIVLTDDLSGAKDVERTKLAFLYNSTLYITKLVLLTNMYCYIFYDYKQCRFTVLKPGI